MHGSTLAARTNAATVPPLHAPVATPHDVKPTPSTPMLTLDPTDLAYYSQPWESAKTFAARGFTVAIKAERRLNNGVPTVSIEQWDAGTLAGGIKKLIREPRDNPHDDVGNPNLLYWLYPLDEIDNLVVEAKDNGRDPESVYKAMEAWCAQMRAIDPTRPLAVNLGVEQSRWAGKADYGRIIKQFDKVVCDYYGILRAMTVPDTLAIIKTFRDTYAPLKLCLWFMEATNQNLGYGSNRLLTTNELAALLDGCHGLGLVPGIFSQVMPGNGIDFSYDAVDAAHLATIGDYLAKVRGVVTPPPAPLPAPAPPVIVPAAVTPFAWPDVFSPVAGTVYDKRK